MLIVGLVSILLPAISRASALSALAEQKDLTPESFIRSFADFTFELGDQVQDPETFLQRKRGDCDDFASLAATVLKGRGYNPKVVVVMMDGATHVVCYVKEAHGFLDFNHRADSHPIIESDGSLEDIAEKVSTYFRVRWHMASEIRYEKRTPVFVTSVFPLAASRETVAAKRREPALVSAPAITASATPAIATP